MMYKVGDYCKHFKGHDLYEKNIYQIMRLGVKGSEIDTETITYSGDHDLATAVNLVVYKNIFQDRLFTREYEDISGELSIDKQVEFDQKYKVQVLTPEEIETIKSEEFISKKRELVKMKK
ncbi:MAG: hypothetical protein IJ463_08390 [Bacilli bacterium]|nr:hypothetical protein [Bacilli bacterium]